MAIEPLRADEDTRERLLRAALKVLSSHGAGGVSLRGIAKLAGLTTGAVYSQFRDRDDLVESAMELFYDAIEELFGPGEDRSIEALLMRWARVAIETALGEARAGFVSVRSSGATEFTHRAVNRLIDRMTKSIDEVATRQRLRLVRSSREIAVGTIALVGGYSELLRFDRNLATSEVALDHVTAFARFCSSLP